MFSGYFRTFGALLAAVFALSWIMAGSALAKADRAKVSQVKPGQTTEAEVRALFGNPFQCFDLGNGAKTMMYRFGMLSADMLKIQVDQNGVVSSYSLMEMNIKSMRKKLDPALWARVKEGETTAAEVERLLGQPMTKETNSDGSKTYTYMSGDLRKGSGEVTRLAIDCSGTVASLSGGPTSGMNTQKHEETKPFDEAHWAMVVEGKSTQEEVVELLGEPRMKNNLPDGTKSYVYWTGLYPGATRWESSVIQLDETGVVISMSRGKAVLDPKTKILQVGQEIDPEKWNTIIPGTSTEADIIELFGQPQGKIPAPDGSKTYFYQYMEVGAKAKSIDNKNKNYNVTFNPRGIVTAIGQYTEPCNFQLHPLDADTTAAWEAVKREKHDAAKIQERLKEPALWVESGVGVKQPLYLYLSGQATVAGYLLDFGPEHRLASVLERNWPLREINALGRKVNRARWNAIRSGKTTIVEVTTLFGEPHFRLSQADGTAVCVYVYGEIKLLSGEQRYGVCQVAVDAAGVVKSFQLF